MRRLPVLAVSLFLAVAPAQARETLAGPVAATVEKVVDGDTLIVRAAVWPGHSVRVSVRLRGIDAPEMRSRCAGERAAAQRARDALERLVAGGSVSLTAISGDKYFGRVLADVATEAGAPLAATLLDEGLVRPWQGRRQAAC